MAALSDYSEKLILDYLMTTGSATRPTNWYVALYTSAPSDAGGGTELSGNGYAREAVTFAAATSGTGTTSNSGAVVFTADGGDWGSVTHMGIHDATLGGTLGLGGPPYRFWCMDSPYAADLPKPPGVEGRIIDRRSFPDVSFHQHKPGMAV